MEQLSLYTWVLATRCSQGAEWSGQLE